MARHSQPGAICGPHKVEHDRYACYRWTTLYRNHPSRGLVRQSPAGHPQGLRCSERPRCSPDAGRLQQTMHRRPHRGRLPSCWQPQATERRPWPRLLRQSAQRCVRRHWQPRCPQSRTPS
eukprot:scaffold139819_cov29-Prasinocladus_malaysianus.AAC.1